MSLQIGKLLGQGGWAYTYLGKYQDKEVAIKMIDLVEFRKRRGKPALLENQSPLTDGMIVKEIKALRQLSADGCSEYVVCYLDAIEYKTPERRYVAIITEYISGGDLYDFLNKSGPLPPQILWPLMKQLLLGLEFIHEAGFAHRDIKPENIMLTEDLTPKYIDFGYACSDACAGNAGTVIYNPPEFYEQEGLVSLEEAQAKDMWSLSIVLYEMAHGLDNLPYKNDFDYEDEIELENAIREAPSIPSHYSLDDGRTNEFLNWLIVNNWKKRPTVGEALDKFEEILETK